LVFCWWEVIIGVGFIINRKKNSTSDTQTNKNEEDWGDIHPSFKSNPELVEE